MSFRPPYLFALVGLLCVSCVEKFKTPSAYDTQRYLCEGADAPYFAKGIIACQDALARGAECGGLVSFKGTMEGRPVVIESALAQAAFGVVQRDGGSDLDSAEGLGSGPFFNFVFKASSLGNGVMDGGARPLALQGAANRLPDPLGDDAVSLAIRVFGSSSIGFNASEGELVVTSQTEDDLTGTFSGAFSGGGADDQLSGCFMVHRSETRTQDQPQ